MANISGKITYEKFIDKLQLKSNKTVDDFNRLLVIAADGMDELQLNYLSTFKDSKLTIDTDTNTIDFPSDFMKFISISIPWEGRMWTFTRDDRLVITTDGSGDSEVYDTSDGEGVNVADNGMVTGFGARGGVNRYFYTIDYRRERIAFSGFMPDHVILRYVSTNIDDTDTNYIPKAVERCLEMYVRWMDADYMDQPANKVMRLEAQYNNEVRKLKKHYAPNIIEIRDMIRKTSSQAVRR